MSTADITTTGVSVSTDPKEVSCMSSSRESSFREWVCSAYLDYPLRVLKPRSSSTMGSLFIRLDWDLEFMSFK